MDSETDRHNAAFLLRLQASSARRRSIFCGILALLVAFLLHIQWLSVVLMILMLIHGLASVVYEHDADKLWPNPDDWNDND